MQDRMHPLLGQQQQPNAPITSTVNLCHLLMLIHSLGGCLSSLVLHHSSLVLRRCGENVVELMLFNRRYALQSIFSALTPRVPQFGEKCFSLIVQLW
jgi:hypothetical protein